MRVRMWGIRGADRRGDERRREEPAGAEEHPVWRDLDEHARALEAMARAIRQDVARRNATTASAALGNLMRQSQQAYDDVGQLLEEAAHAGPLKRMVEI
jgi:hypothetical protein